MYLTAPMVIGHDLQVLESVAGIKIAVDVRDYHSCMQVYGRFAPETLSLIERLVAPGDSVIDVGAQIGYLTSHMARIVGSSGQVHSFEPDPNALRQLDMTVRANGHSWVTIFPMALSDR